MITTCRALYCTVNQEIFARSVKRYICGVKNLRLGHDLPISVNDRVISPFHEESMHMRSFAIVKPSRIFPNLQYISLCTFIISTKYTNKYV